MNKKIIPLLIAVVLVVISVVLIAISNYSYNYDFVIGLVFIIISGLLYSFNEKLHFYIFGLTLIFGILGLISIFVITLRIGIGPFVLNPLFIFLFILFFNFNKEMFHKVFQKKELSEKEREKLIAEKQPRIMFFENKFVDFSDERLQEIMENKTGYTEEAFLAASNLVLRRAQEGPDGN